MMFRASHQALRLVIVMAMGLLCLLVWAPPAHAQWPPVPPTAEDYGCVKWDRYKVPENDDVAYYVNGQGISPDVWTSTAGAARIDVIAKHWNGTTQTFPLTFTAEPDSSCAEAQNVISVTKGTCNTGDNLWNVHVSLVNTTDATGWPLPAGNLVDFDPQFPAYGAQFRYDSEVADGQPATTMLGLPPGTYKVYEVLPSGQRVYRFTRFIDGKCGSAVVSSYDPNYSGGGTVTVIRPRLAAKQITRIRGAKVYVNNRRGKASVRAIVVIDPRRGRTTRYNRVVKPGTQLVITRRNARIPAVVKITYWVNGNKYVWKKRLGGFSS